MEKVLNPSNPSSGVFEMDASACFAMTPLSKPQTVINKVDSPSNEIALRLTVQGVTMEITNQATQALIQNVISALRYSCQVICPAFPKFLSFVAGPT